MAPTLNTVLVALQILLALGIVVGALTTRGRAWLQRTLGIRDVKDTLGTVIDRQDDAKEERAELSDDIETMAAIQEAHSYALVGERELDERAIYEAHREGRDEPAAGDFLNGGGSGSSDPQGDGRPSEFT